MLGIFKHLLKSKVGNILEIGNKQIIIDFPLKGEWQFLRPPGHHPFAFDFVMSNNKRKKYSKHNKLSFFLGYVPADAYYCWGKPVYSPVDGRVLQVGTNCKDHFKTNIWKTISLWYNATYKFKPKEVNGRLDITPNTGNYIMVQTREGYIVFLAHLKNNSIQVTEGEFIKAGDLVGNIGNSGNSTIPHLHINLFDQMENPLKANVLPFVFSQYEELTANGKWKKSVLNIPKVKSYIRISS